MQEHKGAQRGADLFSHPSQLSPELGEWASVPGLYIHSQLGVVQVRTPSIHPGHFCASLCLTFPICAMASHQAQLPVPPLSLDGQQQGPHLPGHCQAPCPLPPLPAIPGAVAAAAPPAAAPPPPPPPPLRLGALRAAAGLGCFDRRTSFSSPAQEEGDLWWREQVREGQETGTGSHLAQSCCRKPGASSRPRQSCVSAPIPTRPVA